MRFDRERADDVPVWLFSADELTFDLTVLPHDALRQAPLSSIDEKPMKRASLAQLRELIAQDEIAGYEAGAMQKSPAIAGLFRIDATLDQRLARSA